jgi:hypothetical protein
MRKRHAFSHTDSLKDGFVFDGTKEKEGSIEKSPYKDVAPKEDVAMFAPEQKRDSEKEGKFPSLEPKSPQSLLKPEWYKSQH